MNKPSFEKIDYRLRPAKNVQRKMLCETFSRFSPIQQLSKYCYIGFGSIGFVDFSLFHQRLGIDKMMSIEKHTDSMERFELNRPYSCIRILWGKSNRVLPTLTWKSRTIIWLDYDQPLDAGILEDVQLVVSKLKSGSAIVVTVDVEPSRPSSDLGSTRLKELEGRIEKRRVPIGTKGSHLSGWGLAGVSRDVLTNEIEETLRDRNGPLSGKAKVHYQQMFNFQYADGPRMLTVGGILLNNNDQGRLPEGHFDDLDFVSNDRTEYRIETPLLTMRELSLLQECLPQKTKDKDYPPVPKADIEKFARIYRYYPNFLEVETY